MAEFVYNNTPFTLIGLSLFFINYGYYLSVYNPPAEPRARNPANQYYCHGAISGGYQVKALNWL